MNRAVFWFLAALTVAISLLADPASAVDRAQSSEEIRIEAAVFHSGDISGGEKLGLDESGWKEVVVPCDWSSCDLESKGQLAWYRLRFSVEDPQAQDWGIHLGRLWGAEEAFLNGKRIGGTGVIADRFAEAWGLPRVYDLPRGVLRRGENVLALRMTDNEIIPGLALDPVLVGNARKLSDRASRDINTIAWGYGAMGAVSLSLWLIWVGAFLSGFRDFWSTVLGLVPLATLGSWGVSWLMLEPQPWLSFAESFIFFGFVLPVLSVFPFALIRSPSKWVLVAVGGMVLTGTLPLVFAFSLETVITVNLVVGGGGLLFSLVGGIVAARHLRRREPRMLKVLSVWGGCQATVCVVALVPTLQQYPILEFSQLAGLAAFGALFWNRYVGFREQLAVADARVLAAADGERRRMAQDLHDGVGQDIQAARMSLQLLSKRGQRVESAELKDAVASLGGSLDQVRALARSAHPDFGDGLALRARIEEYAEQLQRLSGAEVRVSWSGEEADCAGPLALDAFRVTQEAVANALRHGGAAEGGVEVEVKCSALALSIEIEGGAVFTPSVKSGVGWASMRARAEAHRGTVTASERDGRALVRFAVQR